MLGEQAPSATPEGVDVPKKPESTGVVGAEAGKINTAQAKADLERELANPDNRAPTGDLDGEKDSDNGTDTDTNTPNTEKSLMDELTEVYEAAKKNGEDAISATLSTIGFALEKGLNWVTSWFSPEKKEEEKKEEEKKAEKPNESQNRQRQVSVNYKTNIEALLSEFGEKSSEDAKHDFVVVAKHLAEEVEKKYGIPHEVVFAQACLESGLGQSGLTQKGLNCFGIKAFKGYQGGKINMQTTEYFDAKRVMVMSDFRSYGSLRDSFMDYGKLIAESSRYKVAFQYKDSPKKFLSAVIQAGYATDPNYVVKAESVATKYDLSFDA